HDDLGEFGRQPSRLGDDPDAGFRSLRAGHGAADRMLVDADGVTRPLRAGGARQSEKCEGQGDRTDVACHSRPPELAAYCCVLRETPSAAVKPSQPSNTAFFWIPRLPR